MTGEEIINNLLYMKRYVKEDTTEDSTIDEAIKALEQQSCEEGERMKDYNLINQRATTCRHGGHCEWVACDKCNHYEPDGLNQQPCEDAISRKAVLNKLNKLIEVERLQGTDEMGYGRERVSAYESMIFEIENKYLYPSVNPQQPCDDCISRKDVHDMLENLPVTVENKWFNWLQKACIRLAELPSVTPKEKIGYCKDCKWWKDNDGVYRRGVGAESKCPINCKKVYEGNGYCFMFEPQESEEV